MFNAAAAGDVVKPAIRSPRTQNDWTDLARQKRDGAKQLLHMRGQRTMCYEQCGFAIEALLKAALMQAHQKTIWDGEMSDLYRHHDLRRLAAGAGATPEEIQRSFPDYRVAFSVMFQWRRNAGYHPGELSYAEADGLYQACFGKKGVAEWIEKNFNLTL